MKNFKNYTPEKYTKSGFQKMEEGIYKTKFTWVPIEGLLDEF